MKEPFLKYYFRNSWKLLAFFVGTLSIYILVNGFDNDALIWIGISLFINLVYLIGNKITWNKL